MSVKIKIRTPCLNEGRDLSVDPQWTVGKLKSQIAQDWPNQPKPSDQRLIYSGKLLNDIWPCSCCADGWRLGELPTADAAENGPPQQPVSENNNQEVGQDQQQQQQQAVVAWYDMVITFVTTFFTSMVPDVNDPQAF